MSGQAGAGSKDFPNDGEGVMSFSVGSSTEQERGERREKGIVRQGQCLLEVQL
jgi:hypothetical protein